jgi:DNA polymerase I-like protein with 3'-5' exonuclease and polymerase domains
MLKTGEVIFTSSNEKHYVVWYSDNSSNERIDIVKDLESYTGVDTSEYDASYIRGVNFEKCYGDRNLIAGIQKIKMESSLLHVSEKKDVRVDNGQFIMTITKENPDAGILYKMELIAGKISYEHYETSLGRVVLDDIQDVAYISSDRPINWEDYEDINDISTLSRSKTVKSEQAEYYSYDELLRKYPQVSHVIDPSNDYVVVQSYEEAVERLRIWIDSKVQLKSYDIESFDKSWGPTSTNRITGVFLGYGTKWSTYFPFRQQNFDYNLPIEFLQTIFNAINNQPKCPEVILLAHNVKFEIEGFYQEYRDFVRCDVDTYLLGVLVNPIIKKGSHTLKNLTAIVDSKFYLTLEQIFIGPVKFNVLPPEIVKLYGCPDATSPAKIYPYLMEKLPKDERFVESLEMGLPVIKAMNEFYGIRMDQQRLVKLIENEEYKVELLSDMFKKIHHTSRNINSNDVLSDILYNKLRCKVEVRTNKGAPSTSKFAIDRIVDTGYREIDKDTPIPKDILDKDGNVIISGESLAKNKYPSLIIYQTYKKCQKELGALNRLMNHSVDGYFKFYINQVGAGSNRQTSDAHQFSDTMKSCALADSPHHGLVSCDWKQVELRILAGLAGQKDLMELEADADVDIHRAILSIIQKKPMYLISEEDRKKGKSVNFGVVYMMTEYGLARRDFGPAYTKANLAEERKKITDFFNGLPYIKAYLKGNEEFLRKNGYIKTAFNYYRYFPELLDPTYDEKAAQSLIRSGNNTPVQGTGAQMLKMVETNVWNYIRSKGWEKEKEYDGKMLPMVRMILPIHDEILLSYDKSIPKEEIITMFKECMELDIKDMPPFYAAPAFIDNWYQGKDSAYEVDIPFRDKIVEEYKKGNYLLQGKDYLEVLQEYRNGEIREYMEDLIRKYKTVDEVAKHVTHDSLTHTLIETMLTKKDRKKLTHLERIREAVKRYMDNLESNGQLEVVLSKEVDDTTAYMDTDEWAATYTHIDSNGDLIVEEENEEEPDDIGTITELLPVEERTVSECHCLYLMNECLIDLTELDWSTEAETVNQEIQKLTKPDGYYNIVYVVGKRTIKTRLKINYVENEINEIFDKVLNKSEVK